MHAGVLAVSLLADAQVGPRDCREVEKLLPQSGHRSQYYEIYPDGTLESRIEAFCEFNFVLPQVMTNPDSGNVARDKPAIQSSVHAHAPASRAVDGNANGIWTGESCTHTGLRSFHRLSRQFPSFG